MAAGLVCVGHIGILENVDLSALGIVLGVGRDHPPGRPDGAPGGNVGSIQNIHAVAVGLIGRDAHRGPTLGLNLGGVDAHDELAVALYVAQVGSLSRGLGQILDEAVRGICREGQNGGGWGGGHAGNTTHQTGW